MILKILMKLNPESASAAIIIDNKNNFLLQKRDNKKNIFFPGHWGLFGGAKKNNENYITTLKRELQEEIGLIPKEIEFFFKLQFSLEIINKRQIKRFFYICRFKNLFELDIKLSEGEKFGIFTLKQIKKRITKSNILVPYDHFALWFYVNKRNII